jgi:hypothetical protein
MLLNVKMSGLRKLNRSGDEFEQRLVRAGTHNTCALLL